MKRPKTITTPLLSFVTLCALFVIYCAYFYFAVNQLHGVLVYEKHKDRKLSVDIACDELDKQSYTEANRDILSRIVTRIDMADGSLCALYDEGLNILSGRSPLFNVEPFSPLDYPELVNKIKHNKTGETSVWYGGDGAPPHSIKI